MSSRSRKEYIEVTTLRYKKVCRRRKTAILDEFCATCQHLLIKNVYPHYDPNPMSRLKPHFCVAGPRKLTFFKSTDIYKSSIFSPPRMFRYDTLMLSPHV